MGGNMGGLVCLMSRAVFMYICVTPYTELDNLGGC